MAKWTRDWGGSDPNSHRSELFQTETKSGATFISDAALKPEKVLYADLSAEGTAAGGSLGVSLFQENVEDALYSQTDNSVMPHVTSVENVEEIRVRGLSLRTRPRTLGSVAST